MFLDVVEILVVLLNSSCDSKDTFHYVIFYYFRNIVRYLIFVYV